ncbi:MAG: hypothetical protein N3A57_04005 [Negativicutes bacterium]|nr:hypothetical protein [Negativicutes bacterium]
MIKRTRLLNLYDCYAGLLSRRQRSLLGMHLNDDLTVSEIAAEMNVSRQSVHDAVSKAAAALQEYEARLGFCEKMQKLAEKIGELRQILVTGGYAGDSSWLTDRLTDIEAEIVNWPRHAGMDEGGEHVFATE